jgi:hypothetical protein
MSELIMLITTIGLSAAPLIQGLIPQKDNSAQITTCKILAGSRDTEDGDLPSLHLFDSQGNTIGISEPESLGKDSGLGRGGSKDVKIQQLDVQKSNANLEYIAIVNGGNQAVCISMISCTTPSGLVTYAWSGDIAQQCDGVGGIKVPWFYGNTTVAQGDGDNPDIQPACVWVDGDATNGLTTQGIGIHLDSFRSKAAREQDFQANKNKMCLSQPRFAVYEKMSMFDSIPFFKDLPYSRDTFVDDGDKALDQGNWDLKPLDGTLFGGPAFFRRSIGNETEVTDMDSTDNQEVEDDSTHRLVNRQNGRPTPTVTNTAPTPNTKGKTTNGNGKQSANSQNGKSPVGQQTSPAGKPNKSKSTNSDASAPANGKARTSSTNTKAKSTTTTTTTNGSQNRQQGKVSKTSRQPKKGSKARPQQPGSTQARRPWAKNGKLVMSNHKTQSAKTLCGSSGAWGPDFYSASEKLYCDMSARKTYPACGGKTTTACFDTQTKKLRRGKGNSRRDVDGVAIPKKVYDDVEVWG